MKFMILVKSNPGLEEHCRIHERVRAEGVDG